MGKMCPVCQALNVYKSLYLHCDASTMESAIKY
jgi:hypothetical protein